MGEKIDMNYRTYSINGRFLQRKFGGQERFALEIVKSLDKICSPMEIELVVPRNTKSIPVFRNIKVVECGFLNGLLWEQVDFYKYIVRKNKKAIHLLNTWPIFRPDIASIHDVGLITHSKLFTNAHGKLSVIYHKVLFKSAAKRAGMIITISNYSKNEINRVFSIDPRRILVVDCGWQHMKTVVPDINAMTRYQLMKGDYYLSVSSLTPQKNFKWVLEVAKRNKTSKFVIVGEKIGLSSLTEDDMKSEPNVNFIGRVTDGELVELMKNCKAFIHPAIFEGFGMTPMEALSVGAEIIISNQSCLPEIYGNCAHYIDPYDYDVNLDELIKTETDDSANVLDKYSWDHAARTIYEKIILSGDNSE